MSATRGYAFLGTTIGVESDVPSALTWLDEFLTPAFEAWTGDAPEFTVRIASDPVAHATVESTRPRAAAAEVPCFALDQEIVRHRAWIAAGRTIVDDARYGAFYVLAGDRVDVVVHPGSDRFRAGAMRVVRELASARALASSRRLQLHAAGLEIDGRALLLAGPKGAGKTTLLGYLASSTTGARILTNDRALLRVGGGGGDVTVHGMPTIVNVQPGTLELLPRFARGVPAIERPAHLTLAEADAALARVGSANGARQLKLSPPQLARQLGVELSAGAELAAVAFLGRHAEPDGLAVERLDADDAAHRLRATRYGIGSGKDGATVFERFAHARERDAAAEDASIAALAARTPCFALATGHRRLREPSAAAAILSAVL